MGAFDNLKNNTSGGQTSGTGYTAGTVYLGTITQPATTVVSPTGTTYNIPAGKSDRAISVTDAKKLYITDPKVRAQWDKAVAAAGFSSNDPIKSRMLWDMAVDGAADWYQTSNGVQKVTPQQYLQWYAKSQKVGEENLPSRQVYMYDPATINKMIDTTLSNTLGRKATPNEQKEFYTAIKKMIDEGTVTTTETKVNPKTGKKEKVTVQKVGFSQEKAQTYIEEKLKKDNPQDYQEAKSLEFADFLFGLKG